MKEYTLIIEFESGHREYVQIQSITSLSASDRLFKGGKLCKEYAKKSGHGKIVSVRNQEG